MSSSPPSGWALARGARSTWSRFLQSAAALPPRAWRVWGGTLALGMGLCTLVSLALVAAGRALVEDSDWDATTLQGLAEDGPLSFDAGIWWESLGGSAVLIPVVVLGMVLAARVRRPLLALSFPIGYIGIKGLVHTAWAVWDRARPDLIADGLAAPAAASFPSGHTVNTVVIYGLLAFLWMQRTRSPLERALAAALVLALAAVVGLARLALGAHWPSDILAGLILGAAWAVALAAALHRGERAARSLQGP